MTDEDKSALEQALELFVYAPLGLALAAQEDLPGLIAKGRQQVTGQVMVARMIGQFAVTQGRLEAERRLKEATARLSTIGAPPAPAPSSQPPAPAPTPPPAAPQPPAASSPSVPAASEAPSSSPAARRGRKPAVAPEAEAQPPAAADLAIPGYDALSASHVVQRLAGLTAEELEAVRAYESSTRGRRTILSKVAQLQSDGPGR